MKDVTRVNSCSVTNGLKEFVLGYTFFFPKKVVIYNLLNILEVNFMCVYGMNI